MTQQRGARTRLAVDIGGTFTDLVLALPDRTLSAKLLTTHAAPDEAVIAGTEAILREAGVAASSLDLVIHGTTLATNALIERKGARTALITTQAFATRWRSPTSTGSSNTICIWNGRSRWSRAICGWRCRNAWPPMAPCCCALDEAALEASGAAILRQQRDRGGGDQLPALLHQSGARGARARR